MKLNIEFVKRNLISIVVGVVILGVAGVSTVSALLSGTEIPNTIAEATIEPTATIVPIIAPTPTPNVTSEPLSTQAILNFDGVVINASNSVINDLGGNTIPQTTTPIVIQPTKPTPKPAVLKPTPEPTPTLTPPPVPIW